MEFCLLILSLSFFRFFSSETRRRGLELAICPYVQMRVSPENLRHPPTKYSFLVYWVSTQLMLAKRLLVSSITIQLRLLTQALILKYLSDKLSISPKSDICKFPISN